MNDAELKGEIGAYAAMLGWGAGRLALAWSTRRYGPKAKRPAAVAAMVGGVVTIAGALSMWRRG